jgi:ADP-dependent NAD(P)H-hydrate dehydratase / NAD(P)H-hydrate epimerase
MMKVITSVQMQALDRRTITEAGISAKTLMERAGQGVAARLAEVFGPPRGKRVIVLCGKGNNGGDGFVVARLLHRRQAKVLVLTMTPLSELSRDATFMYRRFARGAGPSKVRPYTSKPAVHALLRDSDLIVDALFGTGISAEISGRYADAVDAINEAGRHSDARNSACI